MVGRVLIQGGAASAMRVSFPGYDVNSADLNQTCFDSRWSGCTFYMKGSVVVANNSNTTVNFGETLTEPPVFTGHARQVNASNVPTNTFGNTMNFFKGNGLDIWLYVSVSTSSIFFSVNGYSGYFRFTYLLFKRPAG